MLITNLSYTPQHCVDVFQERLEHDQQLTRAVAWIGISEAAEGLALVILPAADADDQASEKITQVGLAAQLLGRIASVSVWAENSAIEMQGRDLERLYSAFNRKSLKHLGQFFEPNGLVDPGIHSGLKT